MVKRLTKHGNSLALVSRPRGARLLDIDADTPLTSRRWELSGRGGPLGDPARQKKFRAALGVSNRKYGRALKRAGRVKLDPLFPDPSRSRRHPCRPD